MSDKVKKRPRGANIRSVLEAAAKTGLQVTGAVVRDDGGVEFTFAQPGSTQTPAAANPWDQVLGDGPR
jgi:hypothetical protein